MKATAQTRRAAHWVRVLNHDRGVTYKCLKCGFTTEGNAYYEADHEKMIRHAANCVETTKEETSMKAMNKSESIKELATALSAAQAEMPAVPMDGLNPFFKSKFASLGSVIQTAQPILTKHSLAVSQLIISDEGAIGVTTILMHSSGEWLESTVFLPLGDEKGKSLAQIAGSIITYLRRYSLSALLGMYGDEDSDAEPQRRKPVRPKRKAPTPKPRPSSPPKADLDDAIARYTDSKLELPPWVEEIRGAIRDHPQASDSIGPGNGTYVKQLGLSAGRKISVERFHAFVQIVLGHPLADITFGEASVLMDVINSKDFEVKVTSLF